MALLNDISNAARAAQTLDSVREDARGLLIDLDTMYSRIGGAADSISQRCARTGLDAILAELGKEVGGSVATFLGQLPTLWAQFSDLPCPEFYAEPVPPPPLPEPLPEPEPIPDPEPLEPE
jgi:hypothetical protein